MTGLLNIDEWLLFSFNNGRGNMPKSEAEHLYSNNISRHGCHEARSCCGSVTILGVERFKDLHRQPHHPLVVWLWDLPFPWTQPVLLRGSTPRYPQGISSRIPTDTNLWMLKSLIQNSVAFAHGSAHSTLYFKSSLDYLQYLIQCNCYINSCEYNVNALWIVLLSGTSWNCFFK